MVDELGLSFVNIGEFLLEEYFHDVLIHIFDNFLIGLDFIIFFGDYFSVLTLNRLNFLLKFLGQLGYLQFSGD
jgi:hypothetical protein